MTQQVSWLLGALCISACTGAVTGGNGEIPGARDDSGPSSTTATSVGGAASTNTATGAPSTNTTGSVTQVTDPSQDENPVSTDTIDDVVDPLSLPDAVVATSQLPRLTHAQYQNAIVDLLKLDVDVSSELPTEQPSLDGYFAPSLLQVNERLYLDYQRVAELLAQEVVDTPSAYDEVVGCAPTTPGCRDQFLERFLLHAYRRPASASELLRYQTLFDAGTDLVESADAFSAGVQVVIQAVLQSPNFLYRVERGVADPSTVVELTQFEKAARLAFMITDHPPDTDLLDAAASGQLETSVDYIPQATRLMALPAFADRVRDFHARWLQLEGLQGASKDPDAFPEFSAELALNMQEETLRFVEEATLNENGAVLALLTAPFTFVNQSLASIYGLQGSFTSDLARVDFAPTDSRIGLFTQPSFLTGHSSSSTRTSPILRAVYLLRRILCQEIPEPPPGAAATEPPAPETEPVTTRDFFTWKTSLPTCAACHSTINPVGFAFETFDAIGRARSTENGAPVDSSGTVALGDTPIEFDGARELLTAIAQTPEVRACYAKNWLKFSYGRSDTNEDLRTLASLHQNLSDPGFGVRDLVLQLTQSAAFSSLLRAVD